jgi:ABC-type glycerol-3-phosphate transport system permease component
MPEPLTYIARKKAFPWGALVRHLLLIGFSLFILFPVFWVLLLSFKSIPDAMTNRIWPEHGFDFSHYRYAWEHIPSLPKNIWNSALVTLGSVAAATICATLAGYALVHVHTPGRKIILALLVASMFFPTRVTALVAIREIQNHLNLLNTAWGLIFPYTALSLAVSIFIMRGIFEGIPKDLAEAARIDGCGPWRTLWSVMLPMARNGIVVVVIVNFVAAWGEYLLASTLTNDQEVRTLPVVIASASGGQGAWLWPRIAAVYVIAIAPALLIFSITQRWYMQGLQEGALKG